MNFSVSLGQSLGQTRKKKKMSQIDLAAAVDMERTTVSAIENGHSNISMNTFIKLCEGLEADPRIILDHALKGIGK